jgi:hypothetical protein
MRNNTKGAAQIKIIINLTLRMQAVQHHAWSTNPIIMLQTCFYKLKKLFKVPQKHILWLMGNSDNDTEIYV